MFTYATIFTDSKKYKNYHGRLKEQRDVILRERIKKSIQNTDGALPSKIRAVVTSSALTDSRTVV